LQARLCFEHLAHARVARALRLPSPALQEVVELVAGDGEQPRAELPLLRVILELADGARHRAHDFLRHVRGVRLLQSALAAEAIDQRRVDGDELLPGIAAFRVAHAQEETRPGGGCPIHGLADITAEPACFEAQISATCASGKRVTSKRATQHLATDNPEACKVFPPSAVSMTAPFGTGIPSHRHAPLQRDSPPA